MLLDDLVGTIETLKERIATHGPSLRGNEIRTRMALIDPLLTALGWDTANPAAVIPEYNAGPGRPDYGLVGSNGLLVASIEAKRLDESLENHEKQIFDYAWNLQVRYGGLTDGNRWYFVDFSKFTDSDRTILEVSLTSASAYEAALKLLLLWRPNLASGHPVEANSPVLVPQGRPSAAQLTVETTSPVAPPIPQVESTNAPSPILDATNWRPLSDVTYKLGDRKPVGIRFSRSITKPLKNWVDTWFEVCEWLAVNEKLSATDCPVPSPTGKGVRVLINTDSQHPPTKKYPNGNNFAQPRRTSTGLFIETNYNPQNSIKNSKYLLDKFAVPLGTVEMQFE